MMENLIETLDVEVLTTRAVTFMPAVFAAIVIMFGFWLLVALTRPPLRAALKGAGLHETLIRMLVDNLYRWAVLILGLIMAADQIGINVSAALAGIGVVGIAVGFAAQDTLANVISGFLIFIDQPFVVGDWVEVAGEKGEVSNITMRTTRLRTRNNTYIVIPNKNIIDAVLVNHSKHGAVRLDVPVGIAYKEGIAEARKVLLGAVAKLPGVTPAPPPAVVATGLGDSSVDLEVRVWIDDPPSQEVIAAQVVEAAKTALDAAGIEIPFPHLQLFVDNVEDRVWEKAARLAG